MEKKYFLSIVVVGIAIVFLMIFVSWGNNTLVQFSPGEERTSSLNLVDSLGGLSSIIIGLLIIAGITLFILKNKSSPYN